MKSKTLVSRWPFRGGLSFNLEDVKIPAAKQELIGKANLEVEEVMSNYNMGFITYNERYNQIIDIWTRTNFTYHRDADEATDYRQTGIQLHLHDVGFRCTGI
jgi:DNA-directed RNA polymerase beta' subunit